MQNHFIIGENTLLSKGLNLVLENLGQTEVGNLSFEDISNQILKLSEKTEFLWIVVSNEKNSPLKICKQIKIELPKSKIFVFCESKDPILVKDFLKAGISGYFLPDCSVKNIKEAIGQSEKGKIYIDPKLRLFLTQNLLDIGQSNTTLRALTKREKEILQLIVEEYTTQEIANKLFISFCTVETHRLHLIQKMGVRNTAGLVREAVARNIYQTSMNSMTF
ncbi:LuxR C-terminal-related transcriptional regulator [Cognataquiflexum aquatile]|uniref:LuxR C-terminal-related transcriptional regulator n=1 Tax=Cognataquiflexum aquatile TaxID=2249427 RepID=UPI000DEB4831|nr:response regulator transcription factor [Cognataquiflexum aquatile]